ncbi:hypothetical protein NWI33_004291 [Salmonella enterica]|nr:hypothetical protein [Salmonella enterica]EJS8633919.1 hypothetical protein [Salmonella enterica]
MKLNKVSLASLMLFTIATHAAPLPLTYYFKDSDSNNISLDEPATGCVMSGILVHPVDKPESNVIWFNKKTCRNNQYEVSFITNEIKVTDNMIHKGETFKVTPANVKIVHLHSM